MKTCSKCEVEQDLGQFSPNKATRDKLCSQCKSCRREAQRVYRANNAEAQRQATRRWRAENPDLCKELAKKQYEKDKEKRNAASRKWREENPEKAKASSKSWVERNRGKKNFYTMSRYTGLKNRSVAWANPEAIQDFYDTAAALTAETGIKHNVDHIIPLHGDLVSGLHVESNLQILTQAENCSKSNSFKVT